MPPIGRCRYNITVECNTEAKALPLLQKNQMAGSSSPEYLNSFAYGTVCVYRSCQVTFRLVFWK